MRWAGHVAQFKYKKCIQNLFKKPERTSHLGDLDVDWRIY